MQISKTAKMFIIFRNIECFGEFRSLLTYFHRYELSLLMPVVLFRWSTCRGLMTRTSFMRIPSLSLLVRI